MFVVASVAAGYMCKVAFLLSRETQYVEEEGRFPHRSCFSLVHTGR